MMNNYFNVQVTYWSLEDVEYDYKPNCLDYSVEDSKIYWNDFPIAKLSAGNDYLNPNFELIIDDIIEQNQKRKLNDYINK